MTIESAFISAFPADTAYETIGDARVPWHFTTVAAEYGALRSRTALFDLSGCSLVRVSGRGAEDLMTFEFTREVEFLSRETSIIGLLLDDDGTPLDLVTVYRVDDGFLVETSVGRGTATVEHLTRVAPPDTQIERLADIALLGFEGPQAWTVVEELLDEPVSGLPFQGTRPVTSDGISATISRTGFTGEFGFKLMVERADANAIWNKAAMTATPAGQATLEIAMTEFRQPVLHREADIGAGSVIRSGLNWLVDLEKEDFRGRDALLGARADGSRSLPVCFVSDAPLVEIGAPIASTDEVLGHIVHALQSPDRDGWCGVAQVRADVAASGLVFALANTAGTVQTVSAPIRIPTSWGELIGAMQEN
jgi:aminomethyltransferase